MKLTKTEQKVIAVVDGKELYTTLYTKRGKDTKAALAAIDSLKQAGIIYQGHNNLLYRYNRNTVEELNRAVEAYKDAWNRTEAELIQQGQRYLELEKSYRNLQEEYNKSRTK